MTSLMAYSLWFSLFAFFFSSAPSWIGRSLTNSEQCCSGLLSVCVPHSATRRLGPLVWWHLGVSICSCVLSALTLRLFVGRPLLRHRGLAHFLPTDSLSASRGGFRLQIGEWEFPGSPG